MIVSSFFTATAYRSEEFGLSFAHQRLSNRRRPYFFIYVVAANVISFEKLSMAVTLSVRSSRLLCCKIFVLKNFRRTSTLRKFFNTKIFPTKISYNENFPIYGSSNHSQVLELFKILFDSPSYRIRDRTGFVKLWYGIFSYRQFHFNSLESSQLLLEDIIVLRYQVSKPHVDLLYVGPIQLNGCQPVPSPQGWSFSSHH